MNRMLVRRQWIHKDGARRIRGRLWYHAGEAVAALENIGDRIHELTPQQTTGLRAMNKIITRYCPTLLVVSLSMEHLMT
ncbi:hypothetical protein CDL15_Pgr000266 [Punica granatum]|uniref:Uncharacterized protein n=1 Tax=Punica granatum TaxID=22663 RepID=A0A218Y455_PUNGR|nr:hypothetical protein CDL15_Pgr000266 [Punica granatum]